MNRLIAWFAQNHVAANLLMMLIVVTGVLTATTVKQEIFPEISLDLVTVTVPYPGATPAEVESGILLVIEREVKSVDGVKEITATAMENAGVVTIEIDPGADRRRVIDDVKSRVESITTFPGNSERPLIREVVARNLVLNVAIYGNVSERALKEYAEQVRDELVELSNISVVEVTSVRPYEIVLEVGERELERYGLTFDFVAARVRAFSQDVPGGTIETAGGEISVRTRSQAYTGYDFATIPLLTQPNGTILRVEDVARVRDHFAEIDRHARFNDAPSVMLEVYRVGNQDALKVAAEVEQYLAENETPPGVEMAIWRDMSQVLRSRLDTLVQNGISGFLLVFLVLALFLQFRLSIWVSLSIPVAFLGAFMLMPTFDVSINLMSLFAFILALGILVDAAIVAGEAIYARNKKGRITSQEAAIEGAQSVASPIFFAVLTSIVAFVPALFVPGTSGKIWAVIPTVVIAALAFSLVTSLLILPAHLSRLRVRQAGEASRLSRWHPGLWWGKVQAIFSDGLERFIERVFQPILRACLRWRYLTLSLGVAMLVLTLVIMGAGVVKFVFFPKIEADDVVASLRMPEGTPIEVTSAGVRQLEQAALDLQREYQQRYNQAIITNILTQIGESASRGPNPMAGESQASSANLGGVTIELAPAETRPPQLGAEQVLREWRDRIGEVAGARELSFNAELATVGAPINVQLTGRNLDELRDAAAAVRAALPAFDGVFDITDTFQEGKQEVQIVGIRREAQSSGITAAEVGRQVRSAFYGAEVQRVQRGRDEVRVFVRYPREARESLGSLEQMRIRLPDGRTLPFSQVAIYEIGESFSTIKRVDGKRAVNVTADVDTNVNTPNEITRQLAMQPDDPQRAAALPTLAEVLAPFPGVNWTYEGEQREQAETMTALGYGFAVTLVVIYALLAIPLRSYIQPVLIMLAIPFGIIGAVAGHILLGVELSVLSVVGIVALAGVVVNSSLVLIDFINRNKRAAEIDATEAVVEGSLVRFRPIMLTALTTFAGLTPIMMETSLQAQFLIPMAISLAFGVLFSTFITMLMVPAAYLVLEDAKRVLGWTKRGVRELYRFAPPPAEPFAAVRNGEVAPDGSPSSASSARRPVQHTRQETHPFHPRMPEHRS